MAWDGTQVVADVGCGNGIDLRRLVTGRQCRHAIGVDLSAGMLRSLADLHRSGQVTLIQADAQHLPLGEASVEVALAMHMLYHVPRIDAAVTELRRILKPGGTLLASANSATALADIHGVLDAAISARLGRPVQAIPALSFTTETGTAILARQFPEVKLRQQEVALAFPAAAPVVAYLDSIRDPVLRHLGEPLDFDAVLADVAARIDRVIAECGYFRATSRSGVFTCR